MRYELSSKTDGLRELILEHPSYPLMVLCGEEANAGDYSWMVATDVRFFVGEYLDCEHPFRDDYLYCDRDDFEEDLEEWIWGEMCGNEHEPTDAELQARKEIELAKYEGHWKNVIFIYANN